MINRLRSLYQRSPAFRWSARIAGLAVLGAVSTGLWERALKPLWDGCVSGVLSLFARISRGFVETLHQRIGNAYPDEIQRAAAFLLVFMFFYVLALTVVMVHLRLKAHFREHSDENEVESERKATSVSVRHRRLRTVDRLNMIFMLPFLAIALAGWTFTALSESYTRKACSFVERSIEILTPKIDPHAVQELRAEYRAVDSAAKFYALHARLLTLAKKTQTTLPEFVPVRR